MPKISYDEFINERELTLNYAHHVSYPGFFFGGEFSDFGDGKNPAIRVGRSFWEIRAKVITF
jgi:hypothetical protein